MMAQRQGSKFEAKSRVRGLQGSGPIDAIFVNTPLRNYELSPRYNDFTLPVLGLGYVATVAAHHGLNVGVLDGEALGIGFSQIATEINRRNPRWVGFNLLAPTYEHTVSILQLLNPDIRVMLGGHHAKALPDYILNDARITRIDALVLGEAEYRSAALLAGLSTADELPLVHSRLSGRILSGPESHPNKQFLSPDINAMPFVDRQFFANDPYVDGRHLEAAMVGSRGCPFDCSFCGAAVSANPDISIRTRSPENILAELFLLKERFGVTAARFVDDLFLANIKVMTTCASAFVSERLDLVWDATGRINVLANASSSTLELLKRSGCREVALGIETGSDRLLKYIDKKITQIQIESAVLRLCERGIDVKGYFILGLPTETRDEHYLTLSLVRRLWDTTDRLPGNFRCSAFEYRPYPGTPDWRRLEREGYEISKMLTYKAADVPSIGADSLLWDRDEFNFSTDLCFGDVPLQELRRNLSALMRQQKLRSATGENPLHWPLSEAQSSHGRVA